MNAAITVTCPWLFELYKAALAIIGTVVVGQAIVASWQIRNKRRELEMIAAAQFQQVYGDFKDIWRLWKVVRRPDKYALIAPDHARFNLLTRATAAEAKVDALVMKFAVERNLLDKDIDIIGLFRQGFQQLRQRIRDDKSMDFNYEDPEYRLFNDLATAMGRMILSDPPSIPPPSSIAARQLENISKIRKKHWKKALEPYHPYPQQDHDDVELDARPA
jgi:hypothetical protein